MKHDRMLSLCPGAYSGIGGLSLSLRVKWCAIVMIESWMCVNGSFGGCEQDIYNVLLAHVAYD